MRSSGAELFSFGLRAAVVAAIGWFYFWTASPIWSPGSINSAGDDHYNLLARGFLKGQLSLDLAPDPFLASLKNPWDPAQRAGHGLYDASYYHGRYYLYFGPAPALLLFIPFRLLTGRFISQSLASPVFAGAGFLISVWLMEAVRRRHFPRAPSWSAVVCIIALGLADLMPALLRRPGVWEVPITCAYACGMLGLGAIFQALHASRKARWLALASAAFGLAGASRPTYRLSCAARLPPLWVEARSRGPVAAAWRDPAWRRLALAAVLPLAAVGLGLVLYNCRRFGSPAEFGLRYQTGGAVTATSPVFFSWRLLWYDFRVYGLAPAGWGPYFPFVFPAVLPPAPPNFGGQEDPYGILTNIPLVFCGLGLARLAVRGRPGEWGPLSAFCWCAFGAAAGSGLTLLSFNWTANRYMLDFLPAIVVLACVGLLALVTAPWWRGTVRIAGNAVIGLLLVYSALFNVLASFRHNEIFRDVYPTVYLRVAHHWDWIPSVLDRWRGVRYGPVEMMVIFPEGKEGMVEPLMATGRRDRSDYLYVNYLAGDAVRFGFEHTDFGGPLGPPMRLQPGVPHTLRIDLGSLYPPAGHPYFDAFSPGRARLLQTTVRVACDGRVALNRRVRFYDASSPTPSIGTSGGRPGFDRPFSGRILSWRRLSEADLAPPMSGAVRLKVVFPPFGGRRSEPLVSTGEAGRGDLVYVRYESADRVSFGYDHWGVGGFVTAPIAIRPGMAQEIDVDFGALGPTGPGASPSLAERGGRLVIRLNGRTVLNRAAAYYPCDPDTVSIGLNAIGASTATDVFSGTIEKSERLVPARGTP